MAEEAALASLSPLRRYLSPSTFTAAAFALPTISAALIMVGSPGTKELLPLTFVEASVELAADDGLVPAAVVAAAVPPRRRRDPSWRNGQSIKRREEEMVHQGRLRL